MLKKEKPAKTDVQLSLDSRLYQEMEKVCEDLGMTVDEAFEIFARKMVNEQGIPFEVTDKEYPVSDDRSKILHIAEVIAGIGVIAAVTAGTVSVIKAVKDRQ